MKPPPKSSKISLKQKLENKNKKKCQASYQDVPNSSLVADVTPPTWKFHSSNLNVSKSSPSADLAASHFSEIFWPRQLEIQGGQFTFCTSGNNMKQYGSVLWKASSDKKSWKSRKDWQFLKNIFTSERGDGKRSRGVRKRMHKQTPMRTSSDTVLCFSVWWIEPFFRDWGYAKRPRNDQKHFFHIVTMTTWPCVNLLESTLREAAHTTLIFFLGIWLFITFQGTKTLLSSSFGTASILVWLIGNTETPKKKSWA